MGVIFMCFLVCFHLIHLNITSYCLSFKNSLVLGLFESPLGRGSLGSLGSLDYLFNILLIWWWYIIDDQSTGAHSRLGSVG